MKKILKLLLVITLVLTQFLPMTMVNAAETKGTITIKTTTAQTKDGAVTYNIYKMFDLSLSEDGKAYRYTINEGSDWFDFVKEGGAGSSYITLTKSTNNTWVVTEKAGADMAKFAKLALEYAEDEKITATETATIAKGGESVTVSGLDLGYYLVDSSLGSLCGLTTTKPTAEINEKNEEPTLVKDVKEGTNWGDTSYAKIGDVVEYKSTLTVKEGARNYKVYDTMTEGLTFNDDIVIKKGDSVLVKDVDYTLTLDGNYTFVIDFTDTYEDSLKDNEVLVITYSATLNEKAVISTDANTNTTHLTYGDNNEFTSTPDSTNTFSFKFELVKYTGNNVALNGAKFKLYDAETGGNEIKVYLVDEATNTYRVAKTEEELANATTINAGKAIIEGLDGNTTYYLEEVEAPEGYNKLTSRVAVVIAISNLGGSVLEDTVYSDFGSAIKVLNNTGSELPSTGGMGTVLFVTIGSLMVLGAGVLLVTKFRLSKEV